MIIIKWRKDETEEEPFYNLYVCTDNNNEIQIGWLGWGNLEKSWYMHYSIPRIKDKYKKYKQYTKEEVNDVLFRVILDMQADLSYINNMCVNYCNAISDYVIDYVQGIDHNEN